MATEKKNQPEKIFSFDEEFDYLIQSNPGIVWIDTLEEERFVEDILDDVRKIVIDKNNKVAEVKQSISVWMWSFASGMSEITASVDPLLDNVTDNDTTNPIKAIEEIVKIQNNANLSIFIMRGLSELMKMQPVIARKMKDIYKTLYKRNKIILVTATNSDIPLCLDKNITYYSYKTMGREKIQTFITNNLGLLKEAGYDKKKNVKLTYTDSEINDVINACQGLSQNEIRKTVNLLLNKRKELYTPDIIKEKKRIIEKSGILEYWEYLESMDNVGGLGALKPWLRKRKNCLSDEAREFGLPVPRGVLIVGVPGCGKSLCAKAVASSWNLPLVRLDIGKIMGGIVGASESNMRKAIDTVTAVSPCIMWLDEIEKNLSGSASSNYSDSGTLSRVFGTFTTWLQEKTSYVFVIATANDISQLPPELTRKGRLDEIWYVGLPTENERREIFDIQIRKCGRDPKNFDIDKLSKIMHKEKGKVYKYTGAEIEEAIKDSLYTVFDRDSKSNITTEDVEEALTQLVPISKSEEERINKIVSDGEKHYRNASIEIEEQKVTKKSVQINL